MLWRLYALVISLKPNSKGGIKQTIQMNNKNNIKTKWNSCQNYCPFLYLRNHDDTKSIKILTSSSFVPIITVVQLIKKSTKPVGKIYLFIN